MKNEFSCYGWLIIGATYNQTMKCTTPKTKIKQATDPTLKIFFIMLHDIYTCTKLIFLFCVCLIHVFVLYVSPIVCFLISDNWPIHVLILPSLLCTAVRLLIQFWRRKKHGLIGLSALYQGVNQCATQFSAFPCNVLIHPAQRIIGTM